MKLIIVSGWKGSGKDTVADFLVSQHGYRRIAFADVLKDMVSVTYNIPRHYMDDRELKESPLSQYPVDARDAFSESIVSGTVSTEFRPIEGKLFWTPRALCILEGSIKRSVNPNYWVQAALSHCRPGGKYVISDARYRNEIEQVKAALPKAQITSIRIDRFEKSDSNDPSERDLDNYTFSHVLYNSGTKEDLYTLVERLL